MSCVLICILVVVVIVSFRVSAGWCCLELRRYAACVCVSFASCVVWFCVFVRGVLFACLSPCQGSLRAVCCVRVAHRVFCVVDVLFV